MSASKNSWWVFGPALLILSLVSGLLGLVYWASLPNALAIRSVDAAPFHLPQRFEQVDFSDAAWKPLALPATSCAVRCDTPYRVYRHRFNDTSVADDPALWLPFFDANVAVYLNGNRIFQIGSMVAPVDIHRYAPQLLRLPRDQLRPGANELVLLLVEERRGMGGLAAFYIHSYADLARAQAWRRVLVEHLPLGTFWLQLASFLVACVALLRGHRHLPLTWFVAIAPAWMWLTLPDSMRSVVDVSLRVMLLQSCFFVVLGLTPLFVMSLLKAPPLWLQRSLLGFTLFGISLTVACTQLLPLTPYWQIMVPQYLIKLGALTLIPLMLWQIARYGIQQGRSGLGQGVFACASLPGLFGLFDVVRASSGPNEFILMPLAGAALAVALWLELANRYAISQGAVRNFTSELQHRLAEKESTLKQSFNALRDADRERTLVTERQRLLRDMHDGVAGQMTALIHLANDPNAAREQLVAGLREGLTDLRIVLDSLNHGDDDLLDALGSFRQRIHPVLASAGIQLHWDVDPRLVTHGWGPEAVLQVYRMLQESVSNTIKHAGATELRIALNAGPGGLLLQVQDNGRGFDAQSPTQGYGLINLRQRAESLGAKLQLISGARGTCVQWDLPLVPGQSLATPKPEEHTPAVVAARRRVG